MQEIVAITEAPQQPMYSPLKSEGRSFAGVGVTTSLLGFGGAPIGNLFAEVDDASAVAAVQEALRSGISFFDTAPYYGYGLSERRLGRGLAGTPRDSFVLSTKVGRSIVADRGSGAAW